jgi:hypothetical protein
MLYTIHRGNVQGYQGGQASILHLVSSAETIVKNKLPFAFTDGHAEMSISRFFTDLKDLNQIDWKIMQAEIWRDTLQDGDRKRRRQAEFLVHQFFPFDLAETIGVINKDMAAQVTGLMQALKQKPNVKIIPEWYY